MSQGRILDAFRSADLVIAVGSVDGVLTAAAVKRLSGNSDLEVVFTQAFQVGSLPVGEWTGRRVIFVDLAVNNSQPSMTAELVEALRAGGNLLLAVIDEHSQEDWLGVLGTFDGLAVEPQTRNQADPASPQSSGEVLRRALVAEGVEIDAHTAELLAAADEADRGRFGSPLAGMVNQAVKSNIGDNNRRVYLADLLAETREPDAQVVAWVAEYEEMEANAARLLDEAVDLGDGIVRVDTGGVKLDVTSFLFTLYKSWRVVVITGATAYRPELGRPGPVTFVATGDKGLDLLAAVKAAGVAAGGMPQKATIEPKVEPAAVSAIRAALGVTREIVAMPVLRGCTLILERSESGGPVEWHVDHPVYGDYHDQGTYSPEVGAEEWNEVVAHPKAMKLVKGEWEPIRK